MMKIEVLLILLTLTISCVTPEKEVTKNVCVDCGASLTNNPVMEFTQWHAPGCNNL